MPFLSRRKVLRTLTIVLVVIAALFGAAYGWYCYNYPFGRTHCCLKGIGIALEMYAEKGCSHRMMLRRERGATVLIDVAPELMPAARGESQGAY